jgi:hypothetical protein
VVAQDDQHYVHLIQRFSMTSQTMLTLTLVTVFTLDPPSFFSLSRDLGTSPITSVWRQTALDEPDDLSSFIFAGSQLHSASSATPVASAAFENTGENAGAAASAHDQRTTWQTPSIEEVGWEAVFAAGVSESKALADMDESRIGAWGFDSNISGGSVPLKILRVEAMLEAEQHAPAEQQKAKAAERALRIYYHAKWLAERNYARAAEYRYRESARLASLCRRNVLASHSLARLGYFLIKWNRPIDAAVVVEESLRLNSKSNPLAEYLHGVLERSAAGSDLERIQEAEQYIIHAGELPSEELEEERSHLIDQIKYWREAESDPKQCFASSDSANVLICVFMHMFAFMRRFLGR